MSRSKFGWSLLPGCGRLPGEEPYPPCCEDCEVDQSDCPGYNECYKVYIEGSPACCLKHKIEIDCGYCSECENDFHRDCTRENFYCGYEHYDVSYASMRMVLLRSSVHIKDIEKRFNEDRFRRVINFKLYEPFVVAGLVHRLNIRLEMKT